MAAAAKVEGTEAAAEKGIAVTKGKTVASGAERAQIKDEEILALTHERKTTKKDGKERIREVSKKMNNFIREKTKGRQGKKKSKRFLKELKGTKNISNIKSAKKRILIPEVKNTKGETITTRTGIANVFAEFYEKNI